MTESICHLKDVWFTSFFILRRNASSVVPVQILRVWCGFALFDYIPFMGYGFFLCLYIYIFFFIITFLFCFVNH